ncbi:hypothetical protein NQZ68_011452 [Dissostichus eleginoides]|nr:hypothetical protein NQZ68_011452 [Dissostichus eleginoides]
MSDSQKSTQPLESILSPGLVEEVEALCVGVMWVERGWWWQQGASRSQEEPVGSRGHIDQAAAHCSASHLTGQRARKRAGAEPQAASSRVD